VHNGNASGIYETSIRTITMNSHNSLLYPCLMYMTDIDNDGCSDFIVKWKNGNQSTIYIYRGNLNSTFSSYISKTLNSNFYLG